MLFPLTDLFDEEACYRYLVQAFHPDGLHCPQGHRLPDDQAPHDRHRRPIMDYRCRACGAVYNLFTGTLWAKTHHRCSTIVQILKGVADGTPTKHLADELQIDRSTLTTRRQRIQRLLAANFPRPAAPSHG